MVERKKIGPCSTLKAILLISCFLMPVFSPVVAEDGTKVTTSEFTCNLPDGWHQVDNPKALFSAVPRHNDGRVFAIIVEPVTGCPIPREIDNESEYERAYWAKFDANFEAHSHCHITNRDFQLINGIPFRIVDAIREASPAAIGEKFYMEIASTPGNGNIYRLLSIKEGAHPEDDPDLQALAESFSFLQAPRFTWYQPLLHESSNIVGAPIFLVALGMGIYLLTILRRPDLSQNYKMSVGVIALGLLSVNSIWIAGLGSLVGMASNVLMLGFFFLVHPLMRKRFAPIAQGKIVDPTPERVKLHFWILIGSGLLGIAIADVQFIGHTSLFIIAIVNILAIGIFGSILWTKKGDFFKKSEPVVKSEL